MLDNTSRWSHPHGNTVVPSRWQATLPLRIPNDKWLLERQGS